MSATVAIMQEVDIADVIKAAGIDAILGYIEEDVVVGYVEDKTVYSCIDVTELEQKVDMLNEYMTDNELFEYMVQRLGVDDLMDRLEQEISQEG